MARTKAMGVAAGAVGWAAGVWRGRTNGVVGAGGFTSEVCQPWHDLQPLWQPWPGVGFYACQSFQMAATMRALPALDG